MEEDETDKSVDSQTILDIVEENVTDITQPPDESTTIKRPISSKKSKSLENINKTLRNKVIEKAMKEVQKNQQNAESTRNVL